MRRGLRIVEARRGFANLVFSIIDKTKQWLFQDTTQKLICSCWQK
ncbi:hypothetical protein MNB_SV-12-419 [hydrothermal vent metagenome]|uniref:Uncharacterized protein n=1 Tax=hydrothermal vent metagenome TaxID=652676 RepID=A0A1W1BE92_9ZZZZ